MTAKDWLIALGVIIAWGMNFLFMKFALYDVSPMVLGMLRFVFLLLPAIFFLSRPAVPWRWLVAYGLTISFGQFAFMFLALSMGVPTGLAALVHQSQAFFTVLLALLIFQESIMKHQLLAMLIAVMGLVLIGVGQYQGELSSVGLMVVLMGSLSWAAGNLIVKKIGAVNPLSLVVWGNLSALAAFTLGSLWLYGADGMVEQIADLKGLGWLGVMYLAYVASLLGYGGWGYLLSRHPSSQVTPLALFVPVVALFAGMAVLSERLSVWHWLGVVLVMMSLIVHVFGARYLGHH